MEKIELNFAITDFNFEGSNDPLKPTVLPALSTTAIRFNGQTVAGDPDYFYIDVPVGYQLDGLWLEQYVSVDKVAFYAIQAGPVFSAGTDTSRMIDFGHLYDSDKGKNLLADFSLPKLEDFVLWVQQTGATTDYSMIVSFEPQQGQSITGSKRGEVLTGTAAAEEVFADGGDDTIVSSARDDSIDGGDGLDTLVYAKPRSSYRVQKDWDDTMMVTDVTVDTALIPPPPDEGEDLLSNIERLAFSDITLAFDEDGPASEAAKLVLALLGPEALKDQALTGIVLGLIEANMSPLDIITAALPYVFGSEISYETVLAEVWSNISPETFDPNAVPLVIKTVTIDRGPFTNWLTVDEMVYVATSLEVTALKLEAIGIWNTGLAYEPWNG